MSCGILLGGRKATRAVHSVYTGATDTMATLKATAAASRTSFRRGHIFLFCCCLLYFWVCFLFLFAQFIEDSLNFTLKALVISLKLLPAPTPATSLHAVQAAGSKTVAAVTGAPRAAVHGVYGAAQYAVDTLKDAAGYVTGTARAAAAAPRRALDAVAAQLDEGYRKADATGGEPRQPQANC